jgi:hypothetical protein
MGFTLYLHTQLHTFCIGIFLKSKDCERKGTHLVFKCIWHLHYLNLNFHDVCKAQHFPLGLLLPTCVLHERPALHVIFTYIFQTFKSADWSTRNNATASHPSSNGLVSEQQYYQNGSIFVPWCEATLMTVYKQRLTCIACVMHVKVTVFLDATLCSLLDTNYCIRATCSLYHQDA